MKLKKIELEIAKDVKDSVGYITDALIKIHGTENHGFDNDEVKRLLKIEKDFSDSFKPIKENLDRIKSMSENGINAFLESIKILFEPTFRSLFRVSEFGWYISPEVLKKYSISKLTELLNQDNLTELENSILKNANYLAKKTIDKAISNFPERENVLLEILNCFQNKLYHAAINLSYSQTDGICNELWGFGFFDKTGKPEYNLKTLIEFQNYEGGFATLISEQLSIKSNEVTMHSETFKSNFPEKIKFSFNRHLVQHGHSINYGNQTNAIRAILLIDFIIYFKEIKEKN